MFIPDIDKWTKWDRSIADEIAKVDYAFLDGTFYSGDELPGRDMSEIPHPFVTETIELLQNLPLKEKGKVHFIHFNHTNPLLQERKTPRVLQENGFKVAQMGMRLDL